MSILRKTGILALALAAMLGVVAGVEAQETATGDFYAITLGTGIPLPNPDRACAATLIVAGETKILIDTGRAFLPRLTTAGFQDVSMVLYTHFHSDHIGELGELMVNRGITGSDQPLPVYGPKGVKEVVDALLSGYRRDTEYRIAHHGDKWSPNAMKCDVTECEPGVIVDKAGIKVTMFNVNHEPVIPAVGYRVDFGGKSIVVSGDTMKSASLTENAKDCDILIHEAMSETILKGALAGLRNSDPRRAEMLTEMMSHHTTSIEAAEIARDAKVRKLVITHLIPSVAPTDAAEQAFLRGMSDVFKGEIIVARDGMIIRP